MWGGDANCDHDFGAVEGYTGHRGEHKQVPQTKWQSNQEFPPQSDGEKTPQGFCSKCNAWRGQLGLEPTPQLFVAHIVEVFDEVRRVLRPDGVVWLNLGDSYNGSGGAGGDYGKGGLREGEPKYPGRKVKGLKPKDLVGIPWRVAFGLQDDGWWLRSDIIWAKANPMPSSVRDRPTKNHEYIFLLTKSKDYFYDQHAIREGSSKVWNSNKGFHPENQAIRQSVGTAQTGGTGPRLDSNQTGRNKRTVWNVNSHSDLIQIRENLSSDERCYVVDELIKRGLL